MGTIGATIFADGSTMRSSPFQAVLILLAAPVALAQQTVGVPPLSQTSADFCGEVQRRLTGTTQTVATRLHTSYDSFVKSKPQIRPLETQQFVLYENASGAQPMRVSCKTKTADHISAVYGASSVTGGAVSCRDVNRDIIKSVWAAMPAAEREHAAFAPWRVMLDGDDVGVMGNKFVAPYEFAYLGADGLPHVVSRALRVDWENWLWKAAPDRVRGTHYCHLMAPEYARRVMLGAVHLQPGNKR